MVAGVVVEDVLQYFDQGSEVLVEEETQGHFHVHLRVTEKANLSGESCCLGKAASWKPRDLPKCYLVQELKPRAMVSIPCLAIPILLRSTFQMVPTSCVLSPNSSVLRETSFNGPGDLVDGSGTSPAHAAQPWAGERTWASLNVSSPLSCHPSLGASPLENCALYIVISHC